MKISSYFLPMNSPRKVRAKITVYARYGKLISSNPVYIETKTLEEFAETVYNTLRQSVPQASYCILLIPHYGIRTYIDLKE